uniref:Uncharacterized protein n=1 Tax=Sphaerodactylus townsendi TaxID=933632 RepID=A0ACB8ETI9_9SAUR
MWTRMLVFLSAPTPGANAGCAQWGMQQAAKYQSTVTGEETPLATQDNRESKGGGRTLFGCVPHARKAREEGRISAKSWALPSGLAVPQGKRSGVGGGVFLAVCFPGHCLLQVAPASFLFICAAVEREREKACTTATRGVSILGATGGSAGRHPERGAHAKSVNSTPVKRKEGRSLMMGQPAPFPELPPGIYSSAIKSSTAASTHELRVAEKPVP